MSSEIGLQTRWNRFRRRVRRRIYEACGSAKYSRPALNDLDNKLAQYLNFRNGFFIEAGANDGYSQSNTYYLERFLGWRGILIEAIPELYGSCRRERSRSQVYQAALVPTGYAEPTVLMRYANLMSCVQGSLKSEAAESEHITCGLRIQGLDRSYEVDVPARTLDSILAEQTQLPPIDFLSLDVEGFELQVLQGLSLDRYAVRYILVEARFFHEVDEYLSPWYQLVEQLTYHDYFYMRKH